MRETDVKVLDAIRAAWAERGFAPTIREIADRAGVKGSATVQACIVRLIRAGAVTRGDRRMARSLRLVGDA